MAMDWELNLQPIGIVRSCFPCKNGTPRQPTIASKARGQLKISKGIYNNPEHALEGLQEFSYVWLIFVFHKNKSGRFVKAKVSPPRLNGGKIGVFATRSPYRLNPIGLSLVKLESVEGDTLHFSGHDLVDGTPVLDIKPYIREYDAPPDCVGALTPATPRHGEDIQPGGGVTAPPAEARARLVDSHRPIEDLEPPGIGGPASRVCPAGREPPRSATDCPRIDREPPAGDRPGADRGTTPGDPRTDQNRTAANQPAADPPERTTAGVSAPPPDSVSPSPSVHGGDTWLARLRPEPWAVAFTASAESQLLRFSAAADAGAHRLRWLRDTAELRAALTDVLTAEPRSVYRRARADHLLYHFALDACHVTCWFDPGRRLIEVLRLQPLAESPIGDVTSPPVEEGDVTSPSPSPVEEGDVTSPSPVEEGDVTSPSPMEEGDVISPVGEGESGSGPG